MQTKTLWKILPQKLGCPRKFTRLNEVLMMNHEVLFHAVKDLDFGIYIKYCLNGLFFDIHLDTKTKTLEKLITKVLFANDK